MYHRRFLTLISICFSCTCILHAQSTDSLPHADSTRVFWFTTASLDSTTLSPKLTPFDTSLAGTQKYDPLLSWNFFNQSLGNTGHAHKSLFFKPVYKSGFDFGIHSFDGYLFNHENTQWFSSPSPFTELFLLLGSRKEQVFHVTHSHIIKKRLVLGVKYQLVNSRGKDNFRQKSNNSNAVFTSYYSTKNKRYGFYLTYFYNRHKLHENGGVSNDTAYESYRDGSSNYAYSINLDNASNMFVSTGGMLKQYVNLFRAGDTTSDSSFSMGRLNLGRITQTFYFYRQKSRFNNDAFNQGYFPSLPVDTGFTSDSVSFHRFENRLSWTNSEFNDDGRLRRFRMYLEGRYNYIEVRDPLARYYLNQYMPVAGISAIFFRRLSINISADYCLGEYNDGDYSGKASASWRFGNKIKPAGVLSASGSYAYTTAPWTMQMLHFRYFSWDKDFDRPEIITAQLDYSYKRLSVGAIYTRIYNHLYFDDYARPQQYLNNNTEVLSVWIYKNFVIGKFRLDNKVVYQYTPDIGIVHLPMIMASQSYYFTQPMFKKALTAQFGLDLYYNTSWYADSWMPATQQFYLQSDKKIGNYIYADFFLNLRVQRARMFLALTHFNSGLLGYAFYDSPHYPAQDRSFKFGISWLFYD